MKPYKKEKKGMMGTRFRTEFSKQRCVRVHVCVSRYFLNVSIKIIWVMKLEAIFSALIWKINVT